MFKIRLSWCSLLKSITLLVTNWLLAHRAILARKLSLPLPATQFSCDCRHSSPLLILSLVAAPYWLHQIHCTVYTRARRWCSPACRTRRSTTTSPAPSSTRSSGYAVSRVSSQYSAPPISWTTSIIKTLQSCTVLVNVALMQRCCSLEAYLVGVFRFGAP